MSSPRMDRQPMWVRLGSFKIKPGTTDALRARYNGEAVPKVRAYPGNIACMLLEPTGDDDSYAVITIWESRSAGEAYDASGAAKEVVDLVREFFASPPALLSYESTSSFGAAPSNGSR